MNTENNSSKMPDQSSFTKQTKAFKSLRDQRYGARNDGDKKPNGSTFMGRYNRDSVDK